jgi:hypothetical protein
MHRQFTTKEHGIVQGSRWNQGCIIDASVICFMVNHAQVHRAYDEEHG